VDLSAIYLYYTAIVTLHCGLGSTQTLTEMNTRNISWGGKGGRCIGLKTLPPSCADCLEMWEPQPSGTVMGIALPLYIYIYIYIYITFPLLLIPTSFENLTLFCC